MIGVIEGDTRSLDYSSCEYMHGYVECSRTAYACLTLDRFPERSTRGL